jgi:hypothetical protein
MPKADEPRDNGLRTLRPDIALVSMLYLSLCIEYLTSIRTGINAAHLEALFCTRSLISDLVSLVLKHTHNLSGIIRIPHRQFVLPIADREIHVMRDKSSNSLKRSCQGPRRDC